MATYSFELSGSPDARLVDGAFFARDTGAVELFTNKDALYRSLNALSPAPTWQAVYTGAAGLRQAGEPWRSVGLEVTTTWQLAIDPTTSLTRYLCYTDIGFARSEDGGGDVAPHPAPEAPGPPA